MVQKIKRLTLLGLIARILITAILGVLLIAVFYPLFWMILSGFKDTTGLLTNPFGLPDRWRFENYISIWNSGIKQYFFNSLLITALSALLVAILSSFAAFALSRYQCRSRNFWFMYLLCGLMLAPQVSLISDYKILQGLHLYNTYVGLILVYTAFRIPYTMFLMWSYFMTTPRDIEDAARIDGCNSIQSFTRILLPMSKPIMATGTILTVRYVWNDFLFSMVYTESSALRTIPYGLNALKSETGTDWAKLMAGMVISPLPIIIFFCLRQKYFVRGLAVGAVKE